jgi:hypothetical protein
VTSFGSRSEEAEKVDIFSRSTCIISMRVYVIIWHIPLNRRYSAHSHSSLSLNGGLVSLSTPGSSFIRL